MQQSSQVKTSLPAAQEKQEVAKPAAIPVRDLRGTKWLVENHSDRDDLVVDRAEVKHTVYVFNCNNCSLQIKGKVKQIIFDNCKKTSVAFDSVVTSFEIINCQNVKGQVTRRLPTALIEKTGGCTLYLSEESVDCEIITARSFDLKISIQKDTEHIEFPIVEQFKSKWNGKTFVTEAL